jgi:hypothetical protein
MGSVQAPVEAPPAPLVGAPPAAEPLFDVPPAELWTFEPPLPFSLPPAAGAELPPVPSSPVAALLLPPESVSVSPAPSSFPAQATSVDNAISTGTPLMSGWHIQGANLVMVEPRFVDIG